MHRNLLAAAIRDVGHKARSTKTWAMLLGLLSSPLLCALVKLNVVHGSPMGV